MADDQDPIKERKESGNQQFKHNTRSEKQTDMNKSSFTSDHLIQRLNFNEYFIHIFTFISKLTQTVKTVYENLINSLESGKYGSIFRTAHKVFLPFKTVSDIFFFYIPKYVYFVGWCITSISFYLFNFLFNYFVYNPFLNLKRSVLILIYYILFNVGLELFHLASSLAPYVFKAIQFIVYSKLFMYLFVISLIIVSLFLVYLGRFPSLSQLKKFIYRNRKSRPVEKN